MPLHRQLWELGGVAGEEGISAEIWVPGETWSGRLSPKAAGSAVPWPVESWGLLALCLGQSGLALT